MKDISSSSSSCYIANDTKEAYFLSSSLLDDLMVSTTVNVSVVKGGEINSHFARPSPSSSSSSSSSGKKSSSSSTSSSSSSDSTSETTTTKRQRRGTPFPVQIMVEPSDVSKMLAEVRKRLEVNYLHYYHTHRYHHWTSAGFYPPAPKKKHKKKKTRIYVNNVLVASDIRNVVDCLYERNWSSNTRKSCRVVEGGDTTPLDHLYHYDDPKLLQQFHANHSRHHGNRSGGSNKNETSSVFPSYYNYYFPSSITAIHITSMPASRECFRRVRAQYEEERADLVENRFSGRKKKKPSEYSSGVQSDFRAVRGDTRRIELDTCLPKKSPISVLNSVRTVNAFLNVMMSLPEYVEKVVFDKSLLISYDTTVCVRTGADRDVYHKKEGEEAAKLYYEQSAYDDDHEHSHHGEKDEADEEDTEEKQDVNSNLHFDLPAINRLSYYWYRYDLVGAPWQKKDFKSELEHHRFLQDDLGAEYASWLDGGVIKRFVDTLLKLFKSAETIRNEVKLKELQQAVARYYYSNTDFTQFNRKDPTRMLAQKNFPNLLLLSAFDDMMSHVNREQGRSNTSHVFPNHVYHHITDVRQLWMSHQQKNQSRTTFNNFLAKLLSISSSPSTTSTDRLVETLLSLLSREEKSAKTATPSNYTVYDPRHPDEMPKQFAETSIPRALGHLFGHLKQARDNGKGRKADGVSVFDYNAIMLPLFVGFGLNGSKANASPPQLLPPSTSLPSLNAPESKTSFVKLAGSSYLGNGALSIRDTRMWYSAVRERAQIGRQVLVDYDSYDAADMMLSTPIDDTIHQSPGGVDVDDVYGLYDLMYATNATEMMDRRQKIMQKLRTKQTTNATNTHFLYLPVYYSVWPAEDLSLAKYSMTATKTRGGGGGSEIGDDVNTYAEAVPEYDHVSADDATTHPSIISPSPLPIVVASHLLHNHYHWRIPSFEESTAFSVESVFTEQQAVAVPVPVIHKKKNAKDTKKSEAAAAAAALNSVEAGMRMISKLLSPRIVSRSLHFTANAGDVDDDSTLSSINYLLNAGTTPTTPQLLSPTTVAPFPDTASNNTHLVIHQPTLSSENPVGGHLCEDLYSPNSWGIVSIYGPRKLQWISPHPICGNVTTHVPEKLTAAEPFFNATQQTSSHEQRQCYMNQQLLSVNLKESMKSHHPPPLERLLRNCPNWGACWRYKEELKTRKQFQPAVTKQLRSKDKEEDLVVVSIDGRAEEDIKATTNEKGDGDGNDGLMKRTGEGILSPYLPMLLQNNDPLSSLRTNSTHPSKQLGLTGLDAETQASIVWILHASIISGICCVALVLYADIQLTQQKASNLWIRDIQLTQQQKASIVWTLHASVVCGICCVALLVYADIQLTQQKASILWMSASAYIYQTQQKFSIVWIDGVYAYIQLIVWISVCGICCVASLLHAYIRRSNTSQGIGTLGSRSLGRFQSLLMGPIMRSDLFAHRVKKNTASTAGSRSDGHGMSVPRRKTGGARRRSYFKLLTMALLASFATSMMLYSSFD